MLNYLFITINEWMSYSAGIALLGSFLWGLVSVLFSPCHLASIPLIIGYVGGQNKPVEGREGVSYALLFCAGLFVSITLVGVICAMLGRMLGDIGSYWIIAVGAALIWIALNMLGVAHCKLPGNMMSRFQIQGRIGALIIGLAYGILSGSCTFGFIAPLLAIITVQGDILYGSILILLFALGHCLPIAIAGSSTAFAKRMLASQTMQNSSVWFQRGAALIIAGLGIYFIAQPFI